MERPKRSFATDRKPPKILSKSKFLKNTFQIYNSFSKSQAYDSNKELCLLQFLVNKNGPKKYCYKYKALKNTAFIKKPLKCTAAVTTALKILIFKIQTPPKYSADPLSTNDCIAKGRLINRFCPLQCHFNVKGGGGGGGADMTFYFLCQKLKSVGLPEVESFRDSDH